MEITYTQDSSGIYYPNLALPDEPTDLGPFAMRRKKYLEDHRPGLFSSLILRGMLNTSLAETEQTAIELLEKLTAEMAEAEGVTEQLKETDQMEWVRRMNNIRQRATEIVNAEVIFK